MRARLRFFRSPMTMLNPHDRFGDDQDVLDRHEVAHAVRQIRLRAQPAGDGEREALDAPAALVPHVGVQPDVVDRTLRAIALAVADRDLELPRQREVQRVEEKVVVDQLDVGRDVEGLVGEQAGVRAPGDVANAVRAGAAGRDADPVQATVHGADLGDRHPVNLDVLARRQVRDAASVRVGDVVQAIHLGDGEETPGNLDALHVARVIELIVEPIAEAHRPEFVGGDGAADELLDPTGMAGDAVLQLAITRKGHDRVIIDLSSDKSRRSLNQDAQLCRRSRVRNGAVALRSSTEGGSSAR